MITRENERSAPREIGIAKAKTTAKKTIFIIFDMLIGPFLTNTYALAIETILSMYSNISKSIESIKLKRRDYRLGDENISSLNISVAKDHSINSNMPAIDLFFIIILLS